MPQQINATVDCLLVGQFTDDALESSPVQPGVPVGGACEIVETHLLGTFEEPNSAKSVTTQPPFTFVVLLRDNRAINVRGTSLDFATRQGEGLPSHYLIHWDQDKERRTVAIFDAQAVIGIYQET
jgi:hypothetical protein